MQIILAAVVVSSCLCFADSCTTNSFGNIVIAAYDENQTKLVPSTVTGCIEPVGELKNATWLMAYHQPIHSLLHGAVRSLPRLTNLILAYNGVEDVDGGAFLDLGSLETLDLSFNSISFINAFDSLNIKKLILKNNQIVQISSDAFDKLPNLEEVDVRLNLLAEWDPNWFAGSPKLRDINFSSNYIWQLPQDAFKNVKGVHGTGTETVFTKVQLMYNMIERLDNNALRGNEDFGTLNLDWNKISVLNEDMFSSFKHLYRFSVNDNKLACVPKNLYYPYNTTVHALFLRNPLTKECRDRINAAKNE